MGREKPCKPTRKDLVVCENIEREGIFCRQLFLKIEKNMKVALFLLIQSSSLLFSQITVYFECFPLHPHQPPVDVIKQNICTKDNILNNLYQYHDMAKGQVFGHRKPEGYQLRVDYRC